MWILLVILLSNPHHILIISSSYPHHPSLPGLEQARRTLWCLWQALDAGKVDAQDAPGSLEVPDLGFSRHFWNGHFRRLSFSCCERFDMFHERCEHDQTWLFPWYFLMSLNFAGDSSLPSLMLRHVCSSFFLTIILLHYTWGMVSQGKKSFGEGESRLCDNFCSSNSNECSYMAPWIWWFGAMYRLYYCIYHIWVPN